MCILKTPLWLQYKKIDLLGEGLWENQWEDYYSSIAEDDGGLIGLLTVKMERIGKKSKTI